MLVDLTLKFADHQSTEVFENWCNLNGVVLHDVHGIHGIDCFEIFALNDFSDHALLGVYRVMEDDYPLVALKWHGIVINRG